MDVTTLPLCPEPITDGPFDTDAARRLGVFAYNVARRFFDDRPHLVEEAVQETLTRACEHWTRAKRHGNPEAWVVNTATNVCHEKLREEQRGRRFSPRDLVPPADDDEVVRRALLSDALRRLSSRQRLVVVWRYLFDLSVVQTALDLGITESKVRDAAYNGVKKLQRLLGEEWRDAS
jgi:RNA polymerase sigma factor (sigma-70 family)